nr:putative inorganic phosphate cotransporter [Parasteatoda tepidariorum]
MVDPIVDFSEKIKTQKWLDYYLPKRYIFVFLALVGTICMYAIRASISVTIVAMVKQTVVLPEKRSLDSIAECPNFDYNQSKIDNEEYKGEQYDWNIQKQAVILGSYFYGNIATQLLGGVLAEKFGAKHVYGIGILLTATVSLLFPLVASWSYVGVIVNRVIQGLGDGMTFPAINFAISKWSPESERSRSSAVIFSGMQIGTVIGMPIAGLLCTTDALGGWPSVFYIFGVIACLWFVFWLVLIHENPSTHPSISKEELLYIEENKTEIKKKMSRDVWKSIFMSVPVWALAIAHFGFDYGFLVILTELPTYLSTALKYDLKSNGLLSSLPFITNVIGAWTASFAADYLRKSNKMSITAIRKLMNSIGTFGPGLALIAVNFAGCRAELIIALLCIAMALSGFAYSGYNVTHMDMCPDFAGTLYGVTNSIANISGVLAPMTVGILTSNSATLASWSKVFYTTAAVYIACGVIFAMFASAELQPWGTANSESKDEKQAVTDIDIKNVKTNYGDPC